MSRSPLRARAAARLSVAVALALSVATLHAATDPLHEDQVKATNLDSVVVIGARPISPLTFETDPRQPRQPMPASDGADYLKTIPGFNAIRNGGTNGDPVLRGMFGSRLNLLTNEGAMPGACPSRMDNPLSYVSPDTFDKLIVIKGPQTVLWGPGASAGTVRFSRDHEIFDEPTFKGSGSLLFGSAGRNDQVADRTWGAPLG
jgi:iron complex outermembrane receptor protein